MRERFGLCVTAILLASVLFAPLAPAQGLPPADLRVDVNLVNVSFTVRDSNGALKADAKREDFTVLEDGVVQKVQLFARESDTPLTLGIVLDFSGSQMGLFEKNKDTAVQFVRSVLRPSDRAFVVAFSRRVKLVCDLTPPDDKLQAALRTARTWRDAPDLGPSKSYNGASPVRDALYHAAREKLKNIAGRKALVILSDGQDTCSRMSLSDTIEMLQSADTILYALNTGVTRRTKILMPLPALFLRSHLDRVAEETGGREFKMGNTRVEDAFRQIEEELRATYAIGYVSSNPTQDGGFRKIEIRAVLPGLKVRARRGYYARVMQ